MIDVTEEILHTLPAPNQILGEWKMYLRFLKSYFEKHGIERPVIVEIGTQSGAQKDHYEKFFDAVHIGIDISDKNGKPDILGDSHKPGTVSALRKMLDGRPINVLFLDGAHTYNDTVADYWAYGPMTKDVIALHDIRHEKEIGRLWGDLQAAEMGNPDLTFLSIGGWGKGWCELGIGIIAKQNKANL
jgi:hypothetical protein